MRKFIPVTTPGATDADANAAETCGWRKLADGELLATDFSIASRAGYDAVCASAWQVFRSLEPVQRRDRERANQETIGEDGRAPRPDEP